MGDLLCRERSRVRGDKGESIMGKIKRGEWGIETLNICTEDRVDTGQADATELRAGA